MKKALFYLFSISLVILISNLNAQKESVFNNSYTVIVDLGTDDSDPLFSKETLVEVVKERISKRIPSLAYSTVKDNSPIVFSISLLTQASTKLGNFNYASAMNFLSTVNTQVSVNNTCLLLDEKEEMIKAKVRDYIDKWVLEFAANYYKLNN